MPSDAQSNQTLSTAKAQRFQDLISEVSYELIQPQDFSLAVQKVAQCLADSLHAEYVGIFFRRRIRNDFRRFALAVRSGQQPARDLSKESAWCAYDHEYSKDAPTLLWRNNILNDGKEKIANYAEEFLKIVNEFKNILPSRRFEHLIIVPIINHGKQLGAIRIVNHLDPASQFKVSLQDFSAEQDEALVSSIGAMLALTYANHRKKEKLDVLEELGKVIQDADTEEQAVQACLKTLANEKTGFPLAMWRVYDTDNSSSVIWHQCSDGSTLNNVVGDFLPLKASQGVALGEKAQVISIDEKCHYHGWAKDNEFGALYKHPISSLRKQCALVVAAHSRSEFDEAAQHIRISVGFLEATLARIYANSLVREGSEIIGEGLRESVARARKVAPYDSSVLILGESGTGKEIFAKFIKRQSPRSRNAYIIVNCGAIPGDLIESHLFGHERGAFTGATERHEGIFEQANGGTIFLDEIGELTPNAQVKLLRVLDRHPFTRLGGSEEIKVDVRVIAATHRNLQEAVKVGNFREDLHQRLTVYQLELPPLRDRKDDIPALGRYFLYTKARDLGKKVWQIAPEALDKLKSFDWRAGNARELQNVIERAIIVARSDTITADDITFIQSSSATALPNIAEVFSNQAVAMQPFNAEINAQQILELQLRTDIRVGIRTRNEIRKLRGLPAIEGELGEELVGGRPIPSGIEASAPITFDDAARHVIGNALRITSGNVSSAAERLGLKRSTLNSKMGELGIDRDKFQ